MILSSHILTQQYFLTNTKADHQRQHYINNRLAHAYGAQGVFSHEPADDHGVDGIIQLLENIACQNRQHKPHQASAYRSVNQRRHPFPSFCSTAGWREGADLRLTRPPSLALGLLLT